MPSSNPRRTSPLCCGSGGEVAGGFAGAEYGVVNEWFLFCRRRFQRGRSSFCRNLPRSMAVSQCNENTAGPMRPDWRLLLRRSRPTGGRHAHPAEAETRRLVFSRRIPGYSVRRMPASKTSFRKNRNPWPQHPERTPTPGPQVRVEFRRRFASTWSAINTAN